MTYIYNISVLHRNQAWYLKAKLSLSLICVILGLVGLGLLINDFINKPQTIWFKGLDFFTNQCNFMLLAINICYLLNHKYKILKSPRLFNYVGAYSMLMFFVYNILLLPQQISENHDVMFWMGSIIRHEIIPVCFFGLVLLCGYKKEWPKTGKLWKCVGIGMIYPIIYTIYAVFIPLTGEDRSVYGKFSNIWPSVNGSLSSLAYICAVVLLFIGTLVLHWYILNDWWILKKTKKVI